jgi:hypothetical protein
MTDNLFTDNDFLVNVKSGEEIKEIKLSRYSFSIQIKLMKSGLINKLLDFQKKLNIEGKEVNAEDIDFIVFGEMLETSVDIMFEMLPENIQLSKTKKEFSDKLVDGEPMRFIQWIFTQFSRASNFLGQENLVQGAAHKE